MRWTFKRCTYISIQAFEKSDLKKKSYMYYDVYNVWRGADRASHRVINRTVYWLQTGYKTQSYNFVIL